MPRLIGFSGPKGVGKSTVARAVSATLIAEGHVVITTSFAEPMYAMLKALYLDVGYTTDQIRQQLTERKESPNVAFCGHSTRSLLQTLGTEWGRDVLDANFWVRIAQTKALGSRADYVLFDDVRFENEAQMINAQHGKVIELSCEGIGFTREHPSEAGVPEHLIDYLVLNDRDVHVADTARHIAQTLLNDW